MRVLIGTPIHISKDYCMERWLENVSKIEYPANLLLVDNSPGFEYVKKVKAYCKKADVKNFQIVHLDFDQGMGRDEKDKRIEAAQEIIRQYVLTHDYDVWFSWECDQIIPTDTLDRLIKLLKSGNYMLVVHNAWARNNPDESNPDMGITLITRDCLKKHDFLPKRGSPQRQGGERWFKERVFRAGGNYIDVYGLINPIYHLSY
ncbi:MAG: hypothetical protein UV59_C0033G0011 [Candidatus Gottesmanbacteria bacterium GW2011_GWA1_43_11]|uniref:Glycosyltransferase 2-like domain-containing protein n=1 Tax=Candidatus Gottesmanbacteria bacterium GW2011_GWA1_43_11 TaxID=1618436 RepID=A0A0G1FA34_9BACT|nr:MAG: hypothetical protein UV59_C0033G0011 [Candidatus Gottesmanbacteria bacterium GW2011_GWA1_43_11]